MQLSGQQQKGYFMRTLLALLCLAVPAAAQEPGRCGPREAFVAMLADRHGEAQVGYGVVEMGGSPSILEVWRNTASGTWTVFITTPDRGSCMVAHGQGWQDVPQGTAL